MQPEADDEKWRFLALAQSIPQLVWSSHDEGRWTWSSPRWTAYTGLTTRESQDFGWLQAVHPDDHAVTQAAWRKAVDVGVLDVEHRLLGPDRSGVPRWFRTHGEPLPQVPGRSREWLGTCTEMTDGMVEAERRRPQVESLQSHAAHMITLTRAVARRTARVSTTVEDYFLHLDSRLDAIARMQSMVALDPDGGMGIDHMVLDALRAHAVHEGERLHVEGPVLSVRGKVMALLGLTINELAMNAVKHGALSEGQGFISVAWRLDVVGNDTVLQLEWLEKTMPAPNGGVRRKGYGTELIEDTLGRELGATTLLSIGPNQVSCKLMVPLAMDFVLLGEQMRS